MKKNKYFYLLLIAVIVIIASVFLKRGIAYYIRWKGGGLREQLDSTHNEYERQNLIIQLQYFKRKLMNMGMLEKETVPVNIFVTHEEFKRNIHEPLLEFENKRVKNNPIVTFAIQAGNSVSSGVVVNAISVWDSEEHINEWKNVIRTNLYGKGFTSKAPIKTGRE